VDSTAAQITFESYVTSDSDILNCSGQSELVNRRIFPRTAQLSLRPIGLHEHHLQDNEYTTRSMNEATYNLDFPAYSTPTPTIRYPQIPANHESAPILLSQTMTSNSTYVHKDTSIAGPSKDSDPPKYITINPGHRTTHPVPNQRKIAYCKQEENQERG